MWTTITWNETRIVNDIDDNLYWNLNQNVDVTLDASDSYDVDDTFSSLKFLWNYITSENNEYLIDETLLKGSMPVISVNATDTKTFEFELIVSDGRKNSSPVYSSFTVYNGTIHSEIP